VATLEAVPVTKTL